MKITREAKIGLFTAICLATLFWGVNFLKGKNVFSRTNTFHTVFNRVDGLKVTNDVVLSGYKVGTVKSIKFEEGHTGRIIVTLLIEKKYLVPKNSVAKLISSDIMGGKAIRLELAPNQEYHSQGDTLISSIETGLLDQLIYEMVPIKEKAETLMEDLGKVLTAVDQVLNPQNQENINRSFASLSSSLENINSASKSLDELLNSDESDLKKILSNMNELTHSLKGNASGIDTVINNFAAISDTIAKANLGRILTQTDSALMAVNQLITSINAGEGSMGALMHNDTLYNNLEQSAKNLELLLYDMKVNPKRYINFSLIDFSRTRYVESKD
jgi:phospholipid/cholesterol/gamma-HCH transport system substrate-binding protein